jgi:hypothetical protein
MFTNAMARGARLKEMAISDNGRLPTLTVSSIDQLFAMFGESMIAVMDKGVSDMRNLGGVAILARAKSS